MILIISLLVFYIVGIFVTASPFLKVIVWLGNKGKKNNEDSAIFLAFFWPIFAVALLLGISIYGAVKLVRKVAL